MAKSGSTFAKRQKEIAQMERAKERESRRNLRRDSRTDRPARQDGEDDPDLAGIIPGPQPIPDDY